MLQRESPGVSRSSTPDAAPQDSPRGWGKSEAPWSASPGLLQGGPACSWGPC